jgi:modulator of FtsH protease
MASVLVLVPAQGPGVLGAEVLVVGLAAWGWIVAIQLPRLRDWGTMRADLRGPFVLRVVLGQVATLPLVIAGVAVLWVGPGGLYWLMAGTIFSILAALFEAWVLLVEINR